MSQKTDRKNAEKVEQQTEEIRQNGNRSQPGEDNLNQGRMKQTRTEQGGGGGSGGGGGGKNEANRGPSRDDDD